MFTEQELQQMMNGESINEPVEEQGPDTPPEEVVVQEAPVEAPEAQPEQAVEQEEAQAPVEATNAETSTEQEAPAAEVEQTSTNKIAKEDAVSISDIILGNSDKYDKMIVMNSNVHDISADCDVTNYIVYIDTSKNIPCVYDCQRLYVPKTSVKNDDGTWKVTSIEGRRSGIIVHCGTERELVMSKNFIYDCKLTADGAIESIMEYDRKSTITPVNVNATDDYDVAVIYIQKILPKIVKHGKYTTIEQLREQVKLSYNSVYDINALFKIAELRLQLGC